MSFQAPLFLLGLAVVPLALAAYRLARRRPRYQVRFPALPTLAAIAPRPGWRRHLPVALFCLALAGLVTALARPEATVAVPVEQASVMLVTDSSGSMRARDVAPTRLAAATEAAEGFLDELPGEVRVGMVGYASAPHTVQPPSTDRATVRAAVEGLTADGGTATGDALQTALDALGDRGEQREGRPPAAIVLLSDGEQTNGRDGVEVARAAGRLGVPVYTVALGTESATIEVPGPDGFDRSVRVPPDPETLREIAAASGGRAFATADAGRLDTVYDRLGSEIGTRKEQREVTAGFAAGGLVLLLSSVALSLRRFGRVP